MLVLSKLPYKTYLYEMKKNLSSFLHFGDERMTGIVLGRFFSITCHAGYEWNRRITNEKQRAIGFARPDGEGTKIYCVRLAGMTNPISLVGMYLCCVLLFLLKGGFSELSGEMWWGPLVLTLIVAGISAIGDSWTERGMEAYRTVTAYLLDPSNHYSLLN